MTVKVLKRLKIVAIFIQRWRQFQGVSRLSESPPSGEYIKEFDRRGEKIKEKKVRGLSQHNKLHFSIYLVIIRK